MSMTSNPKTFKDDFMSRVGNFDQVLPLLDSLQDVAFFFKDRKCRMVMNDLRAVASCGVATEGETLGRIGHEFFSDERTALYLKQDEEVMSTGKPIINALCPTPEQGSNVMIVYSKIPLRNRRGRIIGLAGVWREVSGVASLPPTYGQLSGVIQLMHDLRRDARRVVLGHVNDFCLGSVRGDGLGLAPCPLAPDRAVRSARYV